MELEGFYSRREATEEARNRGIKLGKNYLAEKAHRGEGPPYHIAFGRAYYGKTTYIEWLIEKLGSPFKSTADRSVRRHQEKNGGSDGSSEGHLRPSFATHSAEKRKQEPYTSAPYRS